MNKKLQVFVSSTYKDLVAERQAVVQAILAAGHIPAGMELFSAGSQTQWEVIQRWIRDCDVYMLILGCRYGSMPPEGDKSYTEMEFDFALEQAKPHFSVILSNSALDQRRQSLGNTATENHLSQHKLEQFRSRILTNKICKFVDNPTEAELAVVHALRQFEYDPSVKGWIRADAGGGVIADRLSAEIEILRSENTELRGQLLKAQSSSRSELSPKSLADVRKVATVTSSTRLNRYLDAGWTLLQTSTRSDGGDTWSAYDVGWHLDGEPPPEYTTY